MSARKRQQRKRVQHRARQVTCSHPLGCSAPPLEGWPYCAEHHQHVQRRAESIRRARETDDFNRDGGGLSAYRGAARSLASQPATPIGPGVLGSRHGASGPDSSLGGAPGVTTSQPPTKGQR